MAPVWFITAASSGFGHGMALSALERGHTVIATARKTSRIQDLADRGAHTLALDVTWPLADQQRIASDIIARHGRVDYLINAAGYILEGSVEECSPAEVQDVFNTNVFGIMNTIKAFLPHLRAQDAVTRPDGRELRATVVAFGSLGSWEGGAGYSAYAMTKFSTSALMESLHRELEPFRIAAVTIEPGYFRTGFLNPGARVVSAERMAVYDDESTPTGKTRAALPAVDGNQPGDVVRGSKVAVDMLTGTGVAEGRKPVGDRIVLGSDCEQVIRGKCGRTLRLLDEWQDVIRSTDYPKE